MEADIFFQKFICYSHFKENYLRRLQEGISPGGLMLKKKPVFIAISEDIRSKWDEVLHTAEMNLIQLLDVESRKAIANLKRM